MVKDSLSKVAEFHALFSVPHLQSPEIPATKRTTLRIDLLQEELNELAAAINAKDLTQIADALCDLQYVLNGAILEFGMQRQFEALFNEVHRSNLSKACKTLSEAEQTVAQYTKQGVSCYYIENQGNFTVYRTKDQKVLKSIHYSPANLGALLNQ